MEIPRWRKACGLALTTCLFSGMPLYAVQVSATELQSCSISIGQGTTTLQQLFDLIEEKFDYSFLVHNNDINLDEKIEMNVGDMTVEEILTNALQSQNADFAINAKRIVVYKKSDKEAVRSMLSAQQTAMQVNGKIVDANTGEPIIGASIVEKGTTNGTITDLDGNFSFKMTGANRVIEVSYVGYVKQQVKVTSEKRITIKLKEDSKTLNEVVVVGYGSQKKANLTGAVTSVKMDDVLGDRPVADIKTALQGSVPGLMISGGSVPGESKTFNIRGTTSINGGGPLVLIDNVPGQIDMINPEDIESVTVLKDAASAAIYGARAAFGVILITTKKGKNNDRLQINYNNNFGFNKSINMPKQAEATQIMRAYLDAGFTGGKWFAEGQDLEKWIGYIEEYRKDPSKFDVTSNGIYIPKEDNPAGIRYYLHENDLYRNMLDNFGFQQSHNVSATGGGEKINYRLSLGYHDSDGVLITDKDTYDRLTVSSYVSANITPWLTQSLDFKWARSNHSKPVASGMWGNRLPSFTPEGEMESINGNMLPINTPRNFILGAYPLKTVEENPRIYSQTRITPFKGFEAIMEYTFDKKIYDRKKYDKPFTNTSVQLGEVTTPSTAVYENVKRATDYNSLNVYGSYKFDIKKEHNFKLMLGYSQEWRKFEELYVNKKAMINEDMPSFSGAYGETMAEDTFTEYSIRSGFFRFNYDYKNRYLVEVNGRYDGSSKFPKETRYGFFPSFSLGWQVGEEKFMDWADSFLNSFKLRTSWGEIGNQAIAEYGFIPFMNSDLASWIDPVTGLRPTTLNPPALVRTNYTWETVRTLDFGFDLSMFNNRLTAVFDWYKRDTKGMLAPGMELPGVVGASAPRQNTADLRTKGWELAVNWRERRGAFNYGIGFNIYDSTSEITKYKNEAGLLDHYYVGQELGNIWGYISDGYYTVDDFTDTQSWQLKEGVTSIKGTNPRPGDIKFKNILDGEGSVPNQIDAGNGTLDNPGDRVVIGNNTPRYQFGINGNVGWKGLDLSFILQGVGKRDVWISDDLRWAFSSGNFGTIFDNQLDYWQPKDPDNGDWTPKNPNAEWHRIYGEKMNAGSNQRVQTKYLLNGSYLRIKNVTLSYTLPKAWIEKVLLTKARVYVSCENLHTFHKLPNGYDPERLSWQYPFYRTISLGINLTL